MGRYWFTDHKVDGAEDEDDGADEKLTSPGGEKGKGRRGQEPSGRWGDRGVMGAGNGLARLRHGDANEIEIGEMAANESRRWLVLSNEHEWRSCLFVAIGG